MVEEATGAVIERAASSAVEGKVSPVVDKVKGAAGKATDVVARGMRPKAD